MSHSNGNQLQRIGIFGGTFDPIHCAHLDVARAALDHAHLDRVLFVVAANPPHKRDDIDASAEDRYSMVEAALRDEPDMEPSDIELHREGPSYTADTIRHLRELYPGATLRLILGFDSLAELMSWREPHYIMEHAPILAVARPGCRPAPPDLAGRYELLPFAETDISSTTIREAIRAGRSLNGLVPPVVERLIREKGLYCATV